MASSGEFCRDCLEDMFQLSIGAALGACGPLACDSSSGLQNLIIEMELLRIAAALQQPEPADERELDRPWSRLLEERFGKDQDPLS